MAALPNEDQPQFPEPLEFFERDFIHPDNKAELEIEQQRWRLLSFRERFRFQRYVASLARQLRRAHYFERMAELHQLRKQFQVERARFNKTTWINADAKASALARLKETAERGKHLKGELSDLHSTFEQWKHYAGWLDYEEEHRHDLQLENKREKRIRKDMRAESKLLENLIIDVWRYTDDCHHTAKATEKHKEKTKVPKFERVVIKPDAHWFYLRTVVHIPIFGYRWRLPEGVTTHRLTEDEVLENLRAATKRQVDAIWTDQNQLVFRVSRLDSPDSLPRNVQWRDGMKYFPEDRVLKFPYTIGVTEGRRFHWLDLTSDTNLLVAGTQGSGKSNLVNGIIATLVSTHSPEELRIVMIDLKGGMEFTHWEELPHLLWEMSKSIDEVKPVLTRLVAIMRGRMEILRKVKAKDLSSYNQRVDQEQRLERLVIVIDEMSNFVGLNTLTEELHNLIFLLVSMGRAVGIHVICCTQHPEVKVIPGRIKTNIPVRLCGWMPTISASQIVLDTPEAARLSKLPGRFALKRGMDQMIIQCPEIPDEEILGVVSSARQAYQNVANDIRDLANQPALVVWNEARVIKAALEWTEGQLSADKLHKMLGEESPGERTLRKLARNILDFWESTGTMPPQEDGSKLEIKRKGKACFIQVIQPISVVTDDADEKGITASPVILSVPMSAPPEIAAD